MFLDHRPDARDGGRRLVRQDEIGKDGVQQFWEVHGRASFLPQLLMLSYMFTKYHQYLTV